MAARAAQIGRHVLCTGGWRVTMHVEVRRGPLQGPDSQRQEPTNRMSAAMFSGTPHSTRASISDEPSAKSPRKQLTKRPEREGLRQRARWHEGVVAATWTPSSSGAGRRRGACSPWVRFGRRSTCGSVARGSPAGELRVVREVAEQPLVLAVRTVRDCLHEQVSADEGALP